jgi:hypothetical protein
MDHRVNYVTDLIADCRVAMDNHRDDPALANPEDRAKVLVALILADAINGLRRTLSGAR